jgi:beta,beta-carotene 9',10'-dioxygenase
VTATATTETGYALGFTTLTRERTLGSLPVEGELPSWLRGSLLRTGPARFEVGERPFRHWFDGLAMLHRFSFDGGRVSYANRYLRGRAHEAAERGRIGYHEFATDPCRSFFRGLFTLFAGGPTDNGSVNVARLGERFLALTESPMPVRFDPRTLDSLGVDALPPGMTPTAHPHQDRSSGDLLGYSTAFGRRSKYLLYRQHAAGGRTVFAAAPAERPSYMHSFAVTERFAVLTACPLVVNPLELVLRRRPFIQSFRWQPERGTRFVVVERDGGRLRGVFRAEPFFMFHHVNAFEDGDELVVDLLAYDDPAIVRELYLDALRSGPPSSPVRLRRFRLGGNGEDAREEDVGGAALELPRINYGRSNGRPYRYVYGVAAGRDEWMAGLVKADVTDGSAETWSEPGSYPGEPVFVPAPDAAGEDDGVLLSVALEPAAGRSSLLVLDAGTMEELARAGVPHHIPFGFHGQFYRS